MRRPAKCCSTSPRCRTTASCRGATSRRNRPAPASPSMRTRRTPAISCSGSSRPTDEPGWDSPWGRGRPGWHIECSAMSERYLGQVFDIHAGGLDLIFPHHENEIAQSRCAHGTDVMANVWMHNGFLQVEGQKMSQEPGQLRHHPRAAGDGEVRRPEMAGRGAAPGHADDALSRADRFLRAQLEEAEKKLRDWQRAADLAPAAGSLPREVMAALSDDLATYAAFQVLTQLAGDAAEGNAAAASLKAALLFFGFDVASANVDEGGVARAIADRLALIAAKNWAEADRIRDELAGAGHPAEGRQGPRHRRTHDDLGGEAVRLAGDRLASADGTHLPLAGEMSGGEGVGGSPPSPDPTETRGRGSIGEDARRAAPPSVQAGDLPRKGGDRLSR